MSLDVITEPIPKGSKESIIVDLRDRTGNITDFSPLSTKFDVRKKNDTSYIQQDIAATVVGTRAFCLVDTTLIEYVAGQYELFVHFDNFPESPRLGPVEFPVID